VPDPDEPKAPAPSPAKPEAAVDPAAMLERIEGDVLEPLAFSGEALARRLFGPRRDKQS
jgi:hypothetical protein